MNAKMNSENHVVLEQYEMLESLYPFKNNHGRALNFDEGDYFLLCHPSVTKKKNWWLVVDYKGQVGYIPSNYVTIVKVTPEFLLNFLHTAIPGLKVNNSDNKLSSETDLTDIHSRLKEKKRQAELGLTSKKQAPLPPDFECTNDIVEKNNKPPESKNEQNSSVSSQNKENGSHNGNDKSPSQSQSKSRSSSLEEINPKTAYLLLDQVRHSTELSYEMSKVAVKVVLSGLQEMLPSEISHYFDAVLSQLQVPLNLSKLTIEETYDANRLKIIFNELTSCKEDSQQRSWMLYEDEPTICEYIKELTSILTNADANVSRHILRQNQYDGVSTLIQYYQMETRWTIRQLLLQSFGVMCSLDVVIVKIMLESILPMELARDMKSNARNVAKLNYSSLLLTMIFSMGEPMPITHFDQLGSEFISFLLDLIENPPDTDLDDQIPDLFINLILSYNLQFTSSDNVVIEALKKRSVAKTFTEKILLLLNREIDPVRVFDHEPAPPDSILKLFIDLFASDDTASLFYTNDIKVLIDIILRQLFDISPGEKRRQYLELCRRVLHTSSYEEHRHRSEDVLKCFTRIFCEEQPESQDDQNLVREISNEFPHLFQK